MKIRRLMLATALLALTAGSARAADGAASWMNICGGNAFNTCASVQLSVVGTTVTMRVKNLSGLFDSYANTVFTSIGLYNLPSGVQANPGFMTMSGPKRAGDDPQHWQVTNDKVIGGGITVDLLGVDGQNLANPQAKLDNGIASACAGSGLPGGGNDLWLTSCDDAFNPGDYVTMSFTVNNTTGWDVASSGLFIKGQNGPGGQSTECLTAGGTANCGTYANPEPTTLILLGSGLGMGLPALRRRRRRSPEA